jgi:hypothetical protein
MQFKDDSLKEELARTPARLQIMGQWFCSLAVSHFAIDPILTRVFESIQVSSGGHEAGRALDFRQEYGGHDVFSPEQERFLVSEMNRRFPRSDKKLTCMVHSFAGGPRHFHIQDNPVKTTDTGESNG